MSTNYLKVRLIQVLLNLNKNFKFFNILFFVLLFFFSATIFGFWNLFSGFYHIIVLIFLLAITITFFIIKKKYFKFVSFKYSINWIEEKNFKSINPITAVKDKPIEINHNKFLWQAHIDQSKNYIKKIKL